MNDLDKEIDILENYIVRCIEEKMDPHFIKLLIERLSKLYDEKFR